MEKNILGDYAIIKELGEGCLGKTYLASHRFIKKNFALKVLPPELASDEEFVQRFEKQIAALATLDHPHLVKIHNVSFSDGKYFLVTDYIDDPQGNNLNLSEYLARHKQSLDENEILDILSQVASALTYAHQRQVEGVYLSHRNLKLSNILIGKGDGALHVKLSDFGLAHVIGEGAILTRSYQLLAKYHNLDLGKIEEQYIAGEKTSMSKLHFSFLQSYAFLAPEQKIYRDSPLGMQADTYAFGVLAYFLLERCYPEGFFNLPSKSHPNFRFDWDSVIYRCLQRDPSKRPSSLSQLMDDLIDPKAYNPHLEEETSSWKEVQQTPQEFPSAFEPTPSPERRTGGTSTITAEAPPQIKEKTVAAQQMMINKVTKLVKETQPKPVLKPQEVERPTYDPDPGAVFQQEMTVGPYKPQTNEVKNIEPLLAEMVVIKGGEFYRGSDEGSRDERPRHQIRLKDFAMDVHPVTNEQFLRFLEVMGGEKDSNNQDIIRLRESRLNRYGGKLVVESGYSKHPVIGITWYGAAAYAKWVGKRLPTEAEWEVAARGGLSDVIYPTGNQIDRKEANFFSSDTTVVMSYPANGFGLFDMAGNVYEWCFDWYDYNYYEASMQEPENPQGPYQGVYRVLRGGCWKSLEEDLRCSHRHRNNPGTINSTYGFRCAADVS